MSEDHRYCEKTDPGGAKWCRGAEGHQGPCEPWSSFHEDGGVER